jgi:hypothetical protein
VYGPEAALFAELFDARVRYSGISFVYQFSGIFASGHHADRRDRAARARGGAAMAHLRLRHVRGRHQRGVRARDESRSGGGHGRLTERRAIGMRTDRLPTDRRPAQVVSSRATP